ncbi:ATP-dependent DNA helicase Q1-like [Mercenaria mercenaria]|uniref:ATP-dependent DNA helicase Q1-like n=1 Tax=Mercenaria mercenaria TaxID=6596 RepID=UPI00234F35C9|nr:ATP-dependent DNA helicase Q1-like [Mercenaria mercenaria]
MEEYRDELKAVKEELQTVEEQIEDLLQRQNDLTVRKDELEAILKQNESRSDVQDQSWEKADFQWSERLQTKLKSVFGIDALRPMQLQTMNVTMSGKDCILIMPTGGGKSLCFQLPALLSKGITLVVSPLVSLMEDQVMALQTYNIDATLLNASSDKDTVKRVQEAMIDHNATLKLLYVTPEKLSKSKRFMARLEKMYKVGRFARLVIDEVHCCSQWGHDFRPDYKFLGIMKRQFPDVPILGLTATATTSVLEDVKKILNIQNCLLFRASFNRPNLFYEVREKPSVHKELMEDIQRLINTKFNNQSGIIYTFSRKESEDVTVDLQSRGIKAGCYHADLSPRERSRVHKAWIENKIHVVVATVAFGMGIDKPDVRFVIHHSLSKSMENLYQESGRAGRDDKKSHCIIYYRLQDVLRQSAMVMAEQTGLNNLYGIMTYCTDVSKCRRSVIARYFGEVWEPSQCNKMCDHCNSNYQVEKKDLTAYCVNVLKILDNAAPLENKLTATKLLDAWQGKGPSVNRVKGTDTGTEREKLERILAYMLMKQYIREDFHFTPYSTISYMVPGPKAGLIRNGTQKVFLDMKGNRNSEGPPSSVSNVKGQESSQSSSVKVKDAKVSQEKPKLVVINRENSVFTKHKHAAPESEGENGSDKVKEKTKLGKAKSVKEVKKRRIVISSDSDSDDLDFGGGDGKLTTKKFKSCAKESSKGGDSEHY